MVQPPELAGGAGFSFEDAVVAVYLGALLGSESAPGLSGRIVERVAQQQVGFGEPLDDLVIDGRAPDDTPARLSLQVKRALTVSAAASNADFREIVTRSWATLAQLDFRETVDRVGAVTGTVAEASRRALNAVCEWARASSTVDTFLAHFQGGAAGEDRRGVLEAFRGILDNYSNGKIDDSGVYRLLQHFVLISIDVLHEGAVDESNAIERLRHHLRDPHRAASLWTRLRVIARDGAGRAAEFNRSSLLSELRGEFRFSGSQSLRQDLATISEEAERSLASISMEIDGTEIQRPVLVEKAKSALESHRFVNLVGLPGTGKSAVLRAAAEDERRNGPILVLKSDRLAGSSWATYATGLGLRTSSIESMLSEISVTGSSVLFVDGIDRVELQHRGIVIDLLTAILRSSLLRTWRVLATSRDNGIEPLRTWLPAGLFDEAGIGTVEVSAFNDDEAERLAQAKPMLRTLLFGDERVREIARRPFFAAVLARSLTVGPSVSSPQSEVELIDAWWTRGGYDSETARALHRQRALIQLAKAGALTLGRRVRLDDFDLDALSDLKADGVIRNVSTGHTVQFAHDIFFEWSFLHLLIDRDEAWLEEIRGVGEPPVLGRAVELLSQTKFSKDLSWEDHLAKLEVAPTRTQWLRAWLVAPFGVPTFEDHAKTVTDAVFRDGATRLSRLAVWFQADKSKANPLVLGRTEVQEQHLSRFEIVRVADALAWPSDFVTWSRFCSWVLRNLDRCPISIVPDLVSAFEVWQNALSDVPNVISAGIIKVTCGWLQDLEDRDHGEELRFDREPWESLGNSERKELEGRLRMLLLRSARVEKARVHAYLSRVEKRRTLRHHAFPSIIAFTPTLASCHAQEMAALTLAELKNDLPAEIAARPVRHGHFRYSFSYHDWHGLAIQHSRADFSPASPLREPFASLFRQAPDTARALVRELTNHAILAWRQLFSLDPQRHATPLPLTLNFPWGAQEYWGDDQVYLWSRGHWAPAPIICGLMALEHWAFSEIDGGRRVEDVIRDVLAGHTSCAVLNIAAALALSTKNISPTTLPMATSQKIWEWDIARFVHDGSGSNLIGFMKPSDLEHAKAVRVGNERPARRMEIRWLAQLFVLTGDAELAKAAREAITSFPSKLVFTFKEEIGDKDHVASLRRRAEIWSEIGVLQNYVAESADDGKAVLVRLENPTATDPDVAAITNRHDRIEEQLTLLNWIFDSLEKKAVSDRLTLPQAFERARKLDRSDLFVEPHGNIRDSDMDQSAVAGTAAIAMLYGGGVADAELNWANEALLRAATTPEDRKDGWFAGSHLMHHPCLYSARGLSGAVRRWPDMADCYKEALLRLAGHPLEEVSEAAIESALSVWELDNNFALIALNLAIQLSIGSMDVPVSVYGYDHASAGERIAVAVAAAIRELRSGELRTFLEALPAPWVFASPRPLGAAPFDRHGEQEPTWRDPDEFLRWDFLPKILPYIPVAIAMNDPRCRPIVLAFCDDLLKWIVERVNPSWEDETAQRRERPSTETLQLRHRFFWLLGQVALYLDPGEANRRILAPMFALDDENAASTIRPFADSVAAGGIIDPPDIRPTALPVLKACVQRVIMDRAWDHARRREGDVHGFDLPQLVHIFLFVATDFAGGAARFANRDWRDIGVILPIVDQFVVSVGDVPHVATSFLTLCERAVEHYPPEVFTEQITTILDKQPGTPVGWRHTTIPSRIASLVHELATRAQPLPATLAQRMLRVLDRLVDMGDRRSAALQTSEIFKNVRV